MIARWLRQFDFFGEQFQLSMHGDRRVKTLAGFCLTMVFYLVILVCGGWFVLDYSDTSNPEGERREIPLTLAQQILVNEDRFFLMVLVKNDNKFVAAGDVSQLLELSVDMVRHSRDRIEDAVAASSTLRSIGLVPCAETRWYRTHPRLGLSSNERVLFDAFAVCPRETGEPLWIKGFDEELESVNLFLQVRKSAALGSSPLPSTPCLELWPLFLQTGYDKSDYDEPLQIARNYKYKYQLAEGLKKEVTLKVSPVKSVSIRGVLGDTRLEHVGAYVKSENSQAFFSAGRELLHIRLVSSADYLEYTRSYTPLYQLISNVGGVIEIVAFLVAVLYSQLNGYVSKKNLTRYGIMKKNKAANLLENTGDPDDPESFHYNSLLKLKLVNSGLLKPKDETEKKRAQFLKACEHLAIERCDIYKIIKNMNELIVFKNLFFTKAHRKLAPVVGISLLDDFDSQATDKQENNMSIAEAIEMLGTSQDPGNPNGENPVQREISKIIREIVRENELPREGQQHEEVSLDGQPLDARGADQGISPLKTVAPADRPADGRCSVEAIKPLPISLDD